MRLCGLLCGFFLFSRLDSRTIQKTVRIIFFVSCKTKSFNINTHESCNNSVSTSALGTCTYLTVDPRTKQFLTEFYKTKSGVCQLLFFDFVFPNKTLNLPYEDVYQDQLLIYLQVLCLNIDLLNLMCLQTKSGECMHR
jgi:hypothetical protein